MQFKKFIGMLFFHQNVVLRPTPALLSVTGVSSQQFLDMLQVQQLNIGKYGNQEKT